jgi:ABC-type glycerol-3-phosphate transport system permease component
MNAPDKTRLKRIRWSGLIRYLFFTVITIVTIGPMLWIFSMSFRTRQEFAANPFGLPTSFYLENYLKIIQDRQMSQFLVNSIIVTSVSLVILLTASILAAYAISRIEFKGRNFLFVLFLMGDMVPIIVLIIPLFILIKFLDIGQTRWAIIMPYVAGSLGFSVFILRGFFRSLSSDIEDAGRIDGCNTLQLIWHIMLPLIRPGIIVVTIMTFIFFWNEYFLASVLLPTQDLFTLPAGIASTFFARFRQDWPAAAAGALLSILPILIVFIFAQDKILEGWRSR